MSVEKKANRRRDTKEKDKEKRRKIGDERETENG